MTRLRRWSLPLLISLALTALAVGVSGRAPVSSREAVRVTSVGSTRQVADSSEAAAAVSAPAPARMLAWGPAPSPLSSAATPPSVVGESAILIDETSGAVLYEKDPHAHLAPASVTKIMTALIALERGNPDDRVEVNIDSRTMRGSTVMGLIPGERLSLEDLLYGMMLPSGNDAALAIAEHISGSTPNFVALMNQRANELGLVDTHFVNPHGLDNPAHYSSAYDLAVLARIAMQRADFRTIVNTKYRVVKGMLATYQLGTLNPLYSRLAGVDGVKTGFTRNARQTLVGSVTRNGHRVIVVVLKSPDRASDGVGLLNWAFDAYSWPSPTTVSADTSLVPGT